LPSVLFALEWLISTVHAGVEMGILRASVLFLRAMFIAKDYLAFENLALRQQIAVQMKSVKRPKLRFRDRYVFIVLSHDRRKIVHFNVTSNPYGQWAGQQIIEAFPWDEAGECGVAIGCPKM